VGEKIMNFKKTKEEIIKFLVRRAWRKQDKDLDMAREKYYSKYKSMNTEYLSMIFNDSSFVNAY
jgi:tRNA splicing ligase